VSPDERVILAPLPLTLPGLRQKKRVLLSTDIDLDELQALPVQKTKDHSIKSGLLLLPGCPLRTNSVSPYLSVSPSCKAGLLGLFLVNALTMSFASAPRRSWSLRETMHRSCLTM